MEGLIWRDKCVMTVWEYQTKLPQYGDGFSENHILANSY